MISVIVGLGLAVAYHLATARVHRWAVRRNTGVGPAAMIVGFVLRLMAITVVLLILGLWTPLNMLALGLAFVALFSILMFWSLYGLLSKDRHHAPPPAGANGL